MNRHPVSRRRLIRGAAATIASPSFAASAQAPSRVLRIGNQKGKLSLPEGRGTLGKQLGPLNVGVKWTEFTAAPVKLEALKLIQKRINVLDPASAGLA